MRPIVLFLLAATLAAQTRVVIHAGTVLDGRGGTLHDQQIVVENGRIAAVGPSSGKADYELGAMTLMPGWIDTHVHLNWHMDANHKSVAGGGKPEDMALYTQAAP